MIKKLPMKYDLFFQNNGSKQVFSVLGVEDVDANPYYLTFKDFVMPEGMEDGEYTYVVFADMLEGVEFEYRACLLDSVARYDGGEYEFRQLKPLTGLLRIGEPAEEGDTIFAKSNNENIYYKR